MKAIHKRISKLDNKLSKAHDVLAPLPWHRVPPELVREVQRFEELIATPPNMGIRAEIEHYWKMIELNPSLQSSQWIMAAPLPYFGDETTDADDWQFMLKRFRPEDPEHILPTSIDPATIVYPTANNKRRP